MGTPATVSPKISLDATAGLSARFSDSVFFCFALFLYSCFFATKDKAFAGSIPWENHVFSGRRNSLLPCEKFSAIEDSHLPGAVGSMGESLLRRTVAVRLCRIFSKKTEVFSKPVKFDANRYRLKGRPTSISYSRSIGNR